MTRVRLQHRVVALSTTWEKKMVQFDSTKRWIGATTCMISRIIVKIKVKFYSNQGLTLEASVPHFLIFWQRTKPFV